MDVAERLAQIDAALLQAHQERAGYRERIGYRTATAAPGLQRGDVALLALTAGAVFGWSFGAVTLALRLAGCS